MRLALWILAIIIGFTLGPRSWSAFKIAYYGWDKEYDKICGQRRGRLQYYNNTNPGTGGALGKVQSLCGVLPAGN